MLLALTDLSLRAISFVSGEKDDRFAGVGFMLSLCLKTRIRGFRPINSRIAEIRIATSPKPISLFSIYAPSRLPSAEDSVQKYEDRKQTFWDTLAEVCNAHSPCLSLVTGDFNARLTFSKTNSTLSYPNPHIGRQLFAQEAPTSQYADNSDFFVRVSSSQPNVYT